MSRDGIARPLPIVQIASHATFKLYEWAAAVVVATSAIGTLGVALSLTSMKRADIAEVDKGSEAPVRVIPVLDLDSPLLKLGSQKYKMPDAWKKSEPKPVREEKAFVSTKAGKKEEDAPPKDVKVADAGTPIIEPDADVVKENPNPEPTTSVEATAAPVASGPGHESGSKDGTETDPLKGRALDRYRSTLSGWFARGFSVKGTGLAQDELTKLRAVATVTIGADGTVSSFSLRASGNAAFDAAARAHLEGKKGDKVPDPPENYPELRQSSVTVSLYCPENQCN